MKERSMNWRLAIRRSGSLERRTTALTLSHTRILIKLAEYDNVVIVCHKYLTGNDWSSLREPITP